MRVLLCLVLTLFLPFHPLAAGSEKESGAGVPKRQELSGTEPLLVGLYINNRLEKEETIYRKKNEYWIPFSLFLEKTGLKEDHRSGTIATYSTSLGVISFDTASLKEFDTIPCISFLDLARYFLASPEFNQPLFAVMLTTAWTPGLPRNIQKTRADVIAPETSLSFIGIETRASSDFSTILSKNLQLTGGGRMLGGVWDASAAGDPSAKFLPARYHWTSFNNNLAIRLGTGYSGSYSLMRTSTFTGVQVGWNNRSIIRQLDMEQNNGSEVFLNIDTNQLRRLEGSGPQAGIAELRFDGEVFARQRIGLDGQFLFDNVRMTSDLRKTEVYIYERSINEKPVKVIDFSQSISGRALPQGELLIKSGIGKNGVLLNPLSGDPETVTGFTSLLYGAHERVTVEAAIEQNPYSRQTDLLFGTIYSPGSNWMAAVYGANANNRLGGDARLEGHYRYWNMLYWGTFRPADFSADNQEKDFNHSFRWSVNPSRKLALQLIGHHEKVGDSLTHSYLLPAFAAYPSSRISLSATPDDTQSYRYEAGFRIGDHNTLRTIYQNRVASLDYLHDISEHLNVRAINDYAIASKLNLANLIIDWYPRERNQDIVETAISSADGAFGIAGSWNRSINTGFRLAMQYAWNMKNAGSLNMGSILSAAAGTAPGKNISLSLSWDLGWSNNGLFPINRNAVTLTRGAVAGTLDIGNDTKLSSADINNISILLNARQVRQQQVNGSFFIGSLPPGIYAVSVDPEKLPMQLVVDQQEKKVEVKNGAVTALTIPIHSEFGIAGQIKDPEGKGIACATVIIAGQDNNTLLKTTANQFGYYRADTLRKGRYQLTAGSSDGPASGPLAKESFTIKDDDIFNLDIILSPIDPPSKK
ncbi:MAG: carboxypeptidase-like regulatory domain-containing protein [Chlorobiaceae bacterium]